MAQRRVDDDMNVPIGKAALQSRNTLFLPLGR